MQDLSVWNSRINEQECIVENKKYLFFNFWKVMIALLLQCSPEVSTRTNKN